jgi:hypothetical protein
MLICFLLVVNVLRVFNHKEILQKKDDLSTLNYYILHKLSDARPGSY